MSLEPRQVIARKALSLINQLQDDPEFRDEQMEDANLALVDHGLYPYMESRKDPVRFVNLLFRDNPLLDEATSLVSLRDIKAQQSLSELAHLLTPPYPGLGRDD